MSSVNKVILIGRLGKDPEVRSLDNGNMVANFTLATSESYKNKSGEKVESTEWHNVVFWGKSVDFIQRYVSKGDLVYIEGKLQTRKWESNGQTKYTTEVIGNNISALSSKNATVNTAGEVTSDLLF